MIQSAFASSMTRGKILTNLVAVCPDGIIGVDQSGLVVVFNEKAASLTGYQKEAVLHSIHIREIYGSLEKAQRINKLLHLPEHGGRGSLEGFETTIVNREGRIIPIRLSAVLLKEEGREVGSVGFFHDLTHQKELEGRLRKLSITDGLTGLYNHRHFHTCLNEEISRVRRYGGSFSLICFDLDRFKNCNDHYGHLEGDNILRLVGNLLRQVTRISDKSFRYGGDEFFVILPETNLAQAASTAEKIRQAFNAEWPYSAGLPGAPAPVTLSIGVVNYIDETTAKDLARRADMTMYTAKRLGGDRVEQG